MRGKWRETILGRSAQVLSHGERKKVVAVSVLQISFGLLDLLGIAVVGMLGALAISGVGSQQPGNRAIDSHSDKNSMSHAWKSLTGGLLVPLLLP